MKNVLAFYPMEATQIGDKRYNNLLPNDISESFRSDLKAFYSRYQSELAMYQLRLSFTAGKSEL